MASKIPIIYRGDDTDFNDDSRLSVSLGSDMQLCGMRVEIVFQGLRKVFAAPENGFALHFSYSSRQTSSFKVGVYRMDVRLRDAKNRVRTLKPKLCIVTDKVSLADEWRNSIAEAEQSLTVLNEFDVFDCEVTLKDLKERLAYLWEKLGGSAGDLDLKNIKDVKSLVRRIWKKYGGTVTNEEELTT